MGGVHLSVKCVCITVTSIFCLLFGCSVILYNSPIFKRPRVRCFHLPPAIDNIEQLDSNKLLGILSHHIVQLTCVYLVILSGCLNTVLICIRNHSLFELCINISNDIVLVFFCSCYVFIVCLISFASYIITSYMDDVRLSHLNKDYLLAYFKYVRTTSECHVTRQMLCLAATALPHEYSNMSWKIIFFIPDMVPCLKNSLKSFYFISHVVPCQNKTLKHCKIL